MHRTVRSAALLSVVLTGWLAHAGELRELRAWQGGVPQLPGAAELYRQQLPRTVERLSHATLVCKVLASPERKWDWIGEPDLTMELSLEGGPTIESWGPEDRYFAIVSAPGVTLERGQRVRLTLYDRDVTERELIGTREQVFDGHLPLRFDTELMTTECRALPEALGADGAAEALARADAALGWLERSSVPNLHRRDLEQPILADDGVYEAIRHAAAWLGWADPRVQQRIAALDGAHRRWRQRLHEAVADQVRALPAPGTPVALDDALTAALDGLECDGAPVTRVPQQVGSCEVRLRLENRSPHPAPLPADEPLAPRWTLLYSDGSTVELEPGLHRSARVEGNGRLRLRLRPRCSSGGCFPRRARPRLLRIDEDGACRLLRLD